MAKQSDFLKILALGWAVVAMSGADAAVVARGTVSRTVADSVSDSEFADVIRAQREARNALDASVLVQEAGAISLATGANACDAGLRKCMREKCGSDFAKCAGDTDSVWGNRLDTCRRNVQCSGHEFTVFAAEIKADRDASAELANYNAIIDCGNKYNSCIFAECGATFSKCLGKAEGDKAIKKCKNIQNECVQMDNGLASRMTQVFGTVRQMAEVQIHQDEQRLRDLRDEMASVCKRAGAMFDERSLDCVYTINFFADAATSPYASKKAYAGATFNCEPGWFGIDITTFKENAYRLTRSQTAASSAILGAGLGTAAGAVTSGAIDRAITTHRAKKDMESIDQKTGGAPQNNSPTQGNNTANEQQGDQNNSNQESSASGSTPPDDESGQGAGDGATTAQQSGGSTESPSAS